MMIYSPDGLMRYNDINATFYDMPLLLQRIKKSTCFHKSIFLVGRVAGVRWTPLRMGEQKRDFAAGEFNLLFLLWNKKGLAFAKPFWWAGVDSNHRSRRRQIYSLLPLATREPTHINFSSPNELVQKIGAGGRTNPHSVRLSCSDKVLTLRT